MKIIAIPRFLLSKTTLAEHLSIHEDTVDARVSDGSLPPPVQFGPSKRWIREDVEDHIRGSVRKPTMDSIERVRNAARKAHG